jgi:hypothetical protein
MAPGTGSMVCAQCHSLRDIIGPGFTAGAHYFDHFQPILEYGPRKESDPAYWANGRPRRFSNDAIGLWQSECFHEAAALLKQVKASDPYYAAAQTQLQKLQR